MRQRTPSVVRAIAACMLLAAATLFIASAIHFGLEFHLGSLMIVDPFAGAKVPEAVIGLVLLSGLANLLMHPRDAWSPTVAAVAFAAVATLLGLTFTVRNRLAGDIVYHVALLTTLAI